MKPWIKLETDLLEDPRIIHLLDELGPKGLGLYTVLRLSVESGMITNMETLITMGSKLSSRRFTVRVLDDFGLFDTRSNGEVILVPYPVLKVDSSCADSQEKEGLEGNPSLSQSNSDEVAAAECEEVPRVCAHMQERTGTRAGLRTGVRAGLRADLRAGLRAGLRAAEPMFSKENKEKRIENREYSSLGSSGGVAAEAGGEGYFLGTEEGAEVMAEVPAEGPADVTTDVPAYIAPEEVEELEGIPADVVEIPSDVVEVPADVVEVPADVVAEKTMMWGSQNYAERDSERVANNLSDGAYGGPLMGPSLDRVTGGVNDRVFDRYRQESWFENIADLLDNRNLAWRETLQMHSGYAPLLNVYWTEAVLFFVEHVIILNQEYQLKTVHGTRSYFANFSRLGGASGKRLMEHLMRIDQQVMNSVQRQNEYMQPLPQGAPPRPSDTAVWNYATDEWMEPR